MSKLKAYYILVPSPASTKAGILSSQVGYRPSMNSSNSSLPVSVASIL